MEGQMRFDQSGASLVFTASCLAIVSFASEARAGSANDTSWVYWRPDGSRTPAHLTGARGDFENGVIIDSSGAVLEIPADRSSEMTATFGPAGPYWEAPVEIAPLSDQYATQLTKPFFDSQR